MHTLRRIILLSWVMASAIGLCQQPPSAAPSRPRLPGGLGSNFIERYVLSPEFRNTYNVTDKQAKKIVHALDALAEEALRLEKEIDGYARQQADLVRRLMADEEASANDLYRMVEKIGTNRMAQAKIAMQRLVVIRDCLTPEQRKHAMNKLVEEYERRQFEKSQAEKPPIVKFPPALK